MRFLLDSSSSQTRRYLRDYDWMDLNVNSQIESYSFFTLYSNERNRDYRKQTIQSQIDSRHAHGCDVQTLCSRCWSSSSRLSQTDSPTHYQWPSQDVQRLCGHLHSTHLYPEESNWTQRRSTHNVQIHWDDSSSRWQPKVWRWRLCSNSSFASTGIYCLVEQDQVSSWLESFFLSFTINEWYSLFLSFTINERQTPCQRTQNWDTQTLSWSRHRCRWDSEASDRIESTHKLLQEWSTGSSKRNRPLHGSLSVHSQTDWESDKSRHRSHWTRSGPQLTAWFLRQLKL